MHRFYLPDAQKQGDELVLAKSEARHALGVLRLRERDRLVVLDGCGNEYMCEICEENRRVAQLKVINRHYVPPLPYQITLVQAVTKGKTMELIVQKATELGVDSIVPILSERSVAQISEKDAATKRRKWNATAVEAVKQCGRAWLPKIEPPMALNAFLSRDEKTDLNLIASLQSGSRHPRHYVDAFVGEHSHIPKSVTIWVGPEGDFTPGEIHAVRSLGALPITLGSLVLRSETAAIYCLSVLSYELQAG